MTSEEKRKHLLRHLFAVAGEIGYTKKTLEEISSSLNLGDRLSKLSESQIRTVMDSLKKAHPAVFKKQTKKPSIPKTGLYSIPSKEQREKAKLLLSQVNEVAPYEISLDNLSLKTFKIHVEKLSSHQFQSLIEALKSMKLRFER